MAANKDFAELAASVKGLIESGAIAEAQRLLQTTKDQNPTREQKLELAHLYRRARLPDRAVMLLRPFVRPSSKKTYVASDQEKLAYAAALTLLDSTKECHKLLQTVENQNLSEFLLFQAFNLIREWDYAGATRSLEAYIQQEEDEYKKAIGSINLLQCYLFCEALDRAQQLIESKTVESFLIQQSKFRLLGNFYELSAQFHFQKQNWELAEQALAKAQKYSQQNKSVDELFVNKWKLLVDMQKGADRQDIKVRWLDMRQKAYALAHFETARDLDYHYSLSVKDEDILRHVYWGTPFNSYREKILKTFASRHSSELPIGNGYARPVFVNHEQLPFFLNTSEMPLFDLDTFNGDARFSRESLLKKLFASLNADFYKVASPYFIFESVYEDEFFNPESSPLKVRQLVFRAKELLKESDAPVSIHFGERGYWLEPLAADCVMIAAHGQLSGGSRHENILSVIRAKFSGETFKTKELLEEVSISQRALADVLKEIIEDGNLEKIGSGPKTTYRLVKR